MKSNHDKQQGVTIIEVLVSVIVLAVGILGVTKLQSASLGNAHKSLGRTHAAYLAYEILDRIRANPTEIYSISEGNMPSSIVDCLGDSKECTSEQIKNFDLAEWKCNFNKFSGTTDCATFTGNILSSVSGQNIYLNGDGSVNCSAVAVSTVSSSAGSSSSVSSNSSSSISGLSQTQCNVKISWLENALGSDNPKTFDYEIEVIL